MVTSCAHRSNRCTSAQLPRAAKGFARLPSKKAGTIIFWDAAMQSESFSISDLEQFASRFYGGRPLLLVPYVYSTIFTTLTQSTSQTATINITANADFICTQFHHRAVVDTTAVQTSATKNAPYVRLLVTDSGTNEQFTNQAVDLEGYSTNGNIVNMLEYPRIISGRSTLTVQVTNFGTAAAVSLATLEIQLHGVLVRAYTN